MIDKELSLQDIDRIVEMAWEDRTTFDAIEVQFGLKEKQVIELMRNNLKKNSWLLWRKRAHERGTNKHAAKRIENITRFKCNLQRSISQNKISKRNK